MIHPSAHHSTTAEAALLSAISTSSTVVEA
jgi:hypothetical protein